MRDALPKAIAVLVVAVLVAGSLRSSVARADRRADRRAAVATRAAAREQARTDSVRLEVRATPIVDRRQEATPAEMRRRVANLAPGTYVADILTEQDSTLYRWPERLLDAVRVWIQPTSTVPDWSGQYPDMARLVFDEWSIAGFPLRFTFIYDSTSADIAIRWVERFPPDAGQRIGETERVQTSTFQVAKAHILVANHDGTGAAMSAATVAGVVRHEVGHALGLNHATDPTSVMFRESATSTISASDRATLRLLYLVPGGSLKD